MSNKNWDAELAKIDKQLASISDEQLLATPANAPAPGAAPTRGAPTRSLPAGNAPAPAATVAAGRSWVSWVKVIIAVAAAAGMMFWPWPARCGGPLMGFTAATGVVALLGAWSAIGTWRHRLGLAHVASLLVTVWGLALGAREVLPRVGYAIPTEARAATWSCEGLPLFAPPAEAPVPTGITP
ncbi:MAG TPA: hypothetical protein DGD08_07180 [Gemmatimonas aurantiaca]|uniref:Uncharacterized protein n=2 Tax=Gemmatimonas aurantiaca TaxID=173480 RepID=A0A3D4V772_9BACT|nr:hypothetical protein [Gemmatimonas aurantiaca]BAH38209.1 hypothetical membrane protein [Gemmatimonas aurantiaca T-27]HCT56983.1 hypothetical protein [Gemmatimonas aurantiaca]